MAAEYTLRLTGVKGESKLILASRLMNVTLPMVYNKTHLQLKENSKGERVEEGARAFMMSSEVTPNPTCMHVLSKKRWHNI